MTGVDELQASNAADELLELVGDELIEAVVIGGFGGWFSERRNELRELDSDEPDKPVPFEKRGVVLSWAEAEPLMRGWSMICGFGSPQCYSIAAYTQTRIIMISQYDGSTGPFVVMRNPVPHYPDMPGG